MRNALNKEDMLSLAFFTVVASGQIHPPIIFVAKLQQKIQN